MTSIASQKAFLYQIQGSADRKRRRRFFYNLQGQHATLISRDSASVKGKFSLSIGKKIDLSKVEEENKDLKLVQKQFEPVVVPKCTEDSDLMDAEGNRKSNSSAQLLRENTDDVPITDELLKNDLIGLKTSVCAECERVGLYTKLNKFKNTAFYRDIADKHSCVICEKRRNVKLLRTKDVKEEKSLLMSIVYPHDFYDRYQSVRRSFNTPTDDTDRKREHKKKFAQKKAGSRKTTFTPLETFAEGDKIVLKPHVVKVKDKKKEYATAVLQVTGGTETPKIPSTVSPFHELSGNKQNVTLSPLQHDLSGTKQKHLRCQPQMKAYFMTSMSEPKFFLSDHRNSFFSQRNPFRSILLPKSEKMEKPKSLEMKHSVINVGSLGLTIGIPEYNDKLADRRNSTNNYLSRTFSSLTNLQRPHSMLPPLKTKIRPPGSVGHRSM